MKKKFPIVYKGETIYMRLTVADKEYLEKLSDDERDEAIGDAMFWSLPKEHLDWLFNESN